MKTISLLIFKLLGWKFIGQTTKEMDKCVMIMAPHTAMSDFAWGRLGLWILKLNARFFIKKEIFIPVGGFLLKKLGGIPIDRGKKNNMVDSVVKMYETHKKLTIVITPEGTRKLTCKWKKGFYEIATKANIPIVLAFVDYGKKEAGVFSVFHPTGNYDEDLITIQGFYKDVTAKHPENFHLSKMYTHAHDEQTKSS